MKITICFFIICDLLTLSACTAVRGEGLTPVGQAAVNSQPGMAKTSAAKMPQFIEFYSPL